MKLLITEEQYEQLLIEADKRQVIINVLKLNQAWADEFHGFNDKLSVWVADTFIKKMVEESNKTKEEVVTYLNDRGPRTHEWTGIYKENYQYIFDWLRGTHGQVNPRELTYDQAYQGSREWHDSLTTQVQLNYQETGEIFIDYRDRRGVGFYWVHLHKSRCDDERARMGHCGNASKGQLISLRGIDSDGNGESYVTIDYNDGICYDFHSRANTKPPARYHRYIMDFLVNTTYPVVKLSKSAHMYEQNFHLADLTQEQRDWVFQRNNSLRFDIEDENTWPEIINAILSGEIDVNTYNFKIKLNLLKRSSYNPDLMAMITQDDESLFNTFMNDNDLFGYDASKRAFFHVFGEQLTNYINNPEVFNTIEKFQSFLRRVSMVFLDVYEMFCTAIDNGFKRFSENIPELISTPRLRKKILKCTDSVDMLNQYSDFTAFDAEGHAFVRMDDEDAFWGVINRENNFIIDPDYVALSYSPMDRNLNILIGKKRDGKFFKIYLETGEVKPLAGR